MTETVAGQDNGQTAAGADTSAAAAAGKDVQGATGQGQGGAQAQTGAGQQVTKPGDAAATKPGSLATGDGEGVDDRQAPATFPDDWREQLAGDDAALLNTMKRYRSPAGFAKAFKEMRTKLSQGAQIKEKPGDDATDEEKAAWRAEHKIPAKVEDYEKNLKLPEGMVLSDVDKALFKGFAAHVHGLDWSQDQVNQAMGWYFKHVSDQQAARADADTDHQAEGIRALKEEMGPGDFKRALSAIDALRRPEIEGEADTLNEILNSYRGPDGRLLGNDPRMVKLLVNAALEIDPQARIAPTDPNMSGKNLDARIAEINQIMADPKRADEYWKNPAMQKEFGNLLAAKEKIARRRAA
jgi:hypothetical protein